MINKEAEKIKNLELDRFINQMKKRMQKGVQEYGEGTFVAFNSIEEAEAELVDFAVYSFFISVKLKYFKEQLRKELKK